MVVEAENDVLALTERNADLEKRKDDFANSVQGLERQCREHAARTKKLVEENRALTKDLNAERAKAEKDAAKTAKAAPKPAEKSTLIFEGPKQKTSSFFIQPEFSDSDEGNTVDTQTSKLQRDVATLSRRNLQLTVQGRQKAKELEQYVADMQALRTNLEATETLLSTSKYREEELNRELREQSERLAAISAEMNNRPPIDTAQLESLNTKFLEAKADVTRLLGVLDQLQEEKWGLLTEIESRTNLEKKLKLQVSLMDERQTSVASYLRDVEEFALRQVATKDEIDRQQWTIAELEGRLVAKSEECLDAEQTMKRLKGRLEFLEEKFRAEEAAAAELAESNLRDLELVDVLKAELEIKRSMLMEVECQNGELQAVVAQLTQNIKTREAKMSEMEVGMEALMRRVDTLQAANSKLRQSDEAVLIAQDALNSDKRRLEKAVAAQKEELERLDRALKDKCCNETQDVQNQVQGLQAAINHLDGELQRANEKTKTAQHVHEVWKTEALSTRSRMDNEMVAMRADVTRLDIMTAHSEAQKSVLEIRNAKLTGEINRANSDLELLQESIRKLGSRLREADSRLMQANADRRHAEIRLQEATLAREKGDWKLLSLESKADEMVQELRRLTSSESLLKRRLENMDTLHQEAVRDSNQQVQSRDRDICVLRSELDVARQQIVDLETTLNLERRAAESRLREAERETSLLKAEVQTLQEAHVDAETTLAAAATRVEELVTVGAREVTTLRVRFSGVREDMARIDGDLKLSKARQHELAEAKQTLELAIPELEEKVSRLTAELTAASQRLWDAESLIASLSAQEGQLGERLSLLQEQDEQWRVRTAELALCREELQTIEAAREQLKATGGALQAELEQTRRQIMAKDSALHLSRLRWEGEQDRILRLEEEHLGLARRAELQETSLDDMSQLVRTLELELQASRQAAADLRIDLEMQRRKSEFEVGEALSKLQGVNSKLQKLETSHKGYVKAKERSLRAMQKDFSAMQDRRDEKQRLLLDLLTRLRTLVSPGSLCSEDTEEFGMEVLLPLEAFIKEHESRQQTHDKERVELESTVESLREQIEVRGTATLICSPNRPTSLGRQIFFGAVPWSWKPRCPRSSKAMSTLRNPK